LGSSDHPINIIQYNTIQYADQVLFKCDKHRTERDKLKDTIHKRGQSWPICKHDLISKHRKAFIKFVNSIELEDA
jgi:hypothetical protein